MKYIIKNCPALCFRLKDNPECNKSLFIACKDISDCLFKRIVEKAKHMQNEWSEELLKYPDKYKYFKSGRSDAGREILQMLEIEECE